MLGEKVGMLRRKLGMNQKDLSDKSGLTQATISRLESGHLKELKSGALIQLADALQVTVDYLIRDQVEPSLRDVQWAPGADGYAISKLVEKWLKLSPEGRKQIDSWMDYQLIMPIIDKLSGPEPHERGGGSPMNRLSAFLEYLRKNQEDEDMATTHSQQSGRERKNEGEKT